MIDIGNDPQVIVCQGPPVCLLEGDDAVAAFDAGPLPNVQLFVSIEDQPSADARIPDLLATPAAVRGVSAEPLLGPVDFTRIATKDQEFGTVYTDALTASCYFIDDRSYHQTLNGPTEIIDQVIVGGESGPGARPMQEAWAESIRDQCRDAGVAFFMKQMAKKAPIPGDLMIREFPT